MCWLTLVSCGSFPDITSRPISEVSSVDMLALIRQRVQEEKVGAPLEHGPRSYAQARRHAGLGERGSESAVNDASGDAGPAVQPIQTVDSQNHISDAAFGAYEASVSSRSWQHVQTCEASTVGRLRIGHVHPFGSSAIQCDTESMARTRSFVAKSASSTCHLGHVWIYSICIWIHYVTIVVTRRRHCQDEFQPNFSRAICTAE
jgi:hypothetical protein